MTNSDFKNCKFAGMPAEVLTKTSEETTKLLVRSSRALPRDEPILITGNAGRSIVKYGVCPGATRIDTLRSNVIDFYVYVRP